MGNFDPLFFPLPPGYGSGKGQRKDLTSKQSLEFSLIRTAKLTASLSPRAKLRPRLLVTSGRLFPSPEIQVSTGKDLLIPRGRAGLEASYLSTPWQQEKKGDLVLYSGDLFPTEARKPPSCPRSHSVNRKGKPTHPSAPLIDRCGFTKRLSTVHSR
ncbi:unnamed protein product [Vicia faba]|uniref:Uncharacterized protein n=1 Tax=Vicia faba TaxID=3906 RepID=A0AAV1A9H1_VICFA|nr:unnamed protein product [Vicia faba]